MVRSLANILVYSGRLRDSYVQKNRDHVERISHERLEIGSKHWLAHYHEHGTKPYTIHPRNKRALSFMTATGRVIRGKVNHPGLASRPVALIQQEDEDRFYVLMEEHFNAA
jgi:hypothetical protein